MEYNLNSNTKLQLEKVALALLATCMVFPKKPMSILLFAFIAISIVLWRVSKNNNYENYNHPARGMAIAYAVFYSLSLLSLLWAVDLHKALSSLESKIYFLLIPFTFYILKLRFNSVSIFLFFFIHSVTICIITCFVVGFKYALTNGDFITPFKYYNFTYWIGHHPGYLSILIDISIVSILYLLKTQGIKKNLILSLLFQIFALIFIGAKSAIVLFLLFGIYELLVSLRHKFSKLNAVTSTLTIACIGACILAVWLSQNTNNRFLNTKSAFELRQGIYHAALEAVQTRPVLGFGTGNAQAALMQEYRLMNLTEPLNEKYNAHNQYLQVTLELGITGLLCLFYVIFIFWKNAINRQLSFFILFIFCFFFLVESYLERQSGLVPFVIWGVVLCSVGKIPKEKKID